MNYKLILKLPLFALALTPLIVTNNTLFPFVFGKTIFIRTAVAIFWILLAVYLFYPHKSTIRINQLKSALIGVIRNPLFIFTSLFVLLMLFSVIFAVNPYRAFFGDIERGEGYLGVLYFFGFFIASLLVFEKKDWLTFFKLSLVVGTILFIHGLFQYDTYERIQSLVGNPAFLGAYFLFIIFAALIIIFLDKKYWWRYTAGFVAGLSLVGIFLTQTRGAILGLIIGIAFAIFYIAIKGRELKIGKVNIQKVSVGLIVFSALFLVVLFFTKANPVWQKIPGVNRFTALSYNNDPSFQTRLIAAGISLDAVNPSKNSLGRFLIGWGPENFNIAYNKHYNPEYLKYENLWFDRAHNKLFDVLVMDGILGFLAYLGMWFSILYLIFKPKTRINTDSRSLEPNQYLYASILFFTAAYFFQNLFLFDQISTYVPFFAFIAFTISSFTNSQNKQLIKESKLSCRRIFSYSSILIALFFVYCLIIYSFTAFYQNIKFTSAIKSGNAQRVFDDVDKFTKPYNYAQRELRNRFLNLTVSYSNDQGIKPLVDKSISLFEEVTLREPFDPRYFTLLADAYRVQGELGNVEARKKSDEYYLKTLELSPKRQELLYNVAVNVYGDKGDFKIMEEYLDKMLNYAPDIPMAKIYYATAITMEGNQRFNKGMDLIESALNNLTLALDGQQLNALRGVYNLYLNYFYNKKDSERFLMAMEGAKKIELMIEKIDEGKYKSGLIKTLPPKKSEEFARGIEGFKEMGWLAIEKK